MSESYADLIGTTVHNGQFDIHETIGNGMCGVIFRGFNHTNQEECAIKATRTAVLDSRKRGYYRREVTFLKKLKGRHPNIVGFVESFEERGRSFIVLEHCGLRTLRDIIGEQNGLTSDERQTRMIYSQILSAVRFLHDLRIYHRDLKPENVMVKLEDNNILVKLIDFGYAADNAICGVGHYGTRPYKCPELLLEDVMAEEGVRNVRIDMWALGIMLYEIITGKLPWSAATEDDIHFQHYSERYRLNDYLHFLSPVSMDISKLLSSLLEPTSPSHGGLSVDDIISRLDNADRLVDLAGVTLHKFYLENKDMVGLKQHITSSSWSAMEYLDLRDVELLTSFYLVKG